MSAHQVRTLLLALVAASFSSAVLAEEENKLPSHCGSEEHMYLTAELVYESDARGIQQKRKNGKILSVCADRKTEPIASLSIRYGNIGAVELEYTGNAARKVRVYLERTGPSMARQVMFFSIGRRTYYISEGVGLEHGVSFYATEGKRLVSYGASGELGVDYQHGELEINFHTPSSSPFVRASPRH